MWRNKSTSMTYRHLLLPLFLWFLGLSEAGQTDHTITEAQPRPFGPGVRCSAATYAALRVCPFAAEYANLEEPWATGPELSLIEKDEPAVFQPEISGNEQEPMPVEPKSPPQAGLPRPIGPEEPWETGPELSLIEKDELAVFQPQISGNEQGPMPVEPTSPPQAGLPRRIGSEYPTEDAGLSFAGPEYYEYAFSSEYEYPDPAPIARVWRRRLTKEAKELETVNEIPWEEPNPIGSSEPDNETLSMRMPIAFAIHDEINQQEDAWNLQVALNLEFLEAEFFLNSAFGEGLDSRAPDLVEGGPVPSGAQKANLDKLTLNITKQFALQEIGHLRAIKETLGKYYFSRPQLDISQQVFAGFIDSAFREKLTPPFDVYANSLNYFIGVYVLPYVGLTGYVGASPYILTPAYRRQTAGLLAVKAGQDAVTREYLFERVQKKVTPYEYTVAEFTERISRLRNQNSQDGALDEGLIVAKELGAEAMAEGNVISADHNSLAYGRTAAQVLSTVYGTGDATKPGGFFPVGAKGKIAQDFLDRSLS